MRVRCEADVHDPNHTGGEKRVGAARQAKLLEDGRRVVQDRVDSRPLLEEHGQRSDGHTVEKRCIAKPK